MRERMLILGGLALFVALFTYPLWHAAATTAATAPDLKLPPPGTTCVMPPAYMRASHMQLLIDWRENFVRNGQRQFRGYDGKLYPVSLGQTCTGECHAKKEFCDRCHTYAGVSGPYCWDCHVDRTLARNTP